MAQHHVIRRCRPNLALSRMRNYIVMAVEYPLNEPGSPELMRLLKDPKIACAFYSHRVAAVLHRVTLLKLNLLFAFYNVTSGGLGVIGRARDG
jgi:hypothetical protein